MTARTLMEESASTIILRKNVLYFRESWRIRMMDRFGNGNMQEMIWLQINEKKNLKDMLQGDLVSK